MQPSSDLERRIAGIAALDQPLRRALYEVLADADGWTSRDDAAAALEVPRSVAAFHLDKLADAGVVTVHFERTTGRQGPGAGRTAKLYRLADDELAASLPERHYDLAGSLLATAIAESTHTGEPVGACLHAAARAAGRRIGEEVTEATKAEETSDHGEATEGSGSTADDQRRQAILSVLARHGYEPEVDPCDAIALANCPFHRLAEEHRELVCGMNLDFLGGLLEGIGETEHLSARLDPAPGFCCVRIDAA